MPKPKPLSCPCCGREKTETREIVCPEKKGLVMCRDCGLQIVKDTVPQAVAAWNRRHMQKTRFCRIDGQFFCNECNAAVLAGQIMPWVNYCPGCGAEVEEEENADD